MRYSVIRAVGKGTFGVVYEAEECDTRRIVAVKKVFQDRNYKVALLSNIHPVEPRAFYYENSESSEHGDTI